MKLPWSRRKRTRSNSIKATRPHPRKKSMTCLDAGGAHGAAAATVTLVASSHNTRSTNHALSVHAQLSPRRTMENCAEAYALAYPFGNRGCRGTSSSLRTTRSSMARRSRKPSSMIIYRQSSSTMEQEHHPTVPLAAADRRSQVLAQQPPLRLHPKLGRTGVQLHP